MILPRDTAKLGQWLRNNVVEPCRVSVERRISQARSIRQWLYTGSDTSTPAIFNRIIVHCDRLASNVYSPADLRFFIEYEFDHGRAALDQAEVAARYLTREFGRRDFDILFGEAIEVCIPYGAAVLKSMWGHDGPTARLLMPWQLGVYREDETSLEHQEAIVETTYITEEQFWRRISHRADAVELMRRARSYARKNVDVDILPAGGIHQILLSGSAPFVQNSGDPAAAGGAVNIGADPQSAVLSPEIAGALLKVHEGYVINDETGDYTTFQLVEPDILLHPRSIRNNLFIPYEHPYTLVQVNPQPGYIWGRSELSDLILLQAFIRDRLYDIKELMNLQYDRRYSFIGFSGMGDELYDQFKRDGWIANEMPTAKVEDQTPPMPEHWREEFAMVDGLFDAIAGFDNVLGGKESPQIRSASHYQGAVRMASGRLKDRAIRSERQVAEFGEKMLWLMEAKDPRSHWTQEADPQRRSDFILSTLYDDARVIVDGHSASPAFSQDHAQMAAFLKKDGDIDGTDLLDMLPVPNRDRLKEKLREREAAKMKMIESLPPELRMEVLAGVHAPRGRQAGGRR